MSQEQREYIKISKGHNAKIVKAHVTALDFKDAGQHIVYIPSLNLSAYGDTEAEADEMMKIVLGETIDALNKCSSFEIMKELKSFGWERSRLFTAQLSKAAHIDRAGILREFSLAEDTQINERLLTA